MPSPWQRRRDPDDVPTPVAVAVSDFCRRAGGQASPVEIREALSVLSEDEDFRVRALTDGEPKAKPLGPWAVVDVLRGTPEDLAATRQGAGYYELARELVSARSHPEPGPVAAAAPIVPPAPMVPPRAAPSAPASTRAGKVAAPTVAERIAPKKRAASEVSSVMEEELPALAPARGRELPKPKGRFSNVEPQRLSVDALFFSDAQQMLAARMQQYPDRFALTRALGEQYGGKKEGQTLRTEDVERALVHHKLMEQLERKERESVLAAYTELRGSASRVAHTLGLTVPEVNRLVKAVGLQSEVEEIRERFRREALSPKNLGQRLDLLGRGKYLSDLGIRRKFDEALRADLKKVLGKVASAARDLDDLYAQAARREGTQAELLHRAVEKLELSGEVRKLLATAED